MTTSNTQHTMWLTPVHPVDPVHVLYKLVNMERENWCKPISKENIQKLQLYRVNLEKSSLDLLLDGNLILSTIYTRLKPLNNGILTVRSISSNPIKYEDIKCVILGFKHAKDGVIIEIFNIKEMKIQSILFYQVYKWQDGDDYSSSTLVQVEGNCE